MPSSRTQIIEFVHLAFLDALSKRLDPSRYILKGGANLRYFFGSVRYSEDIDLDLCGKEPWDLERKIDGVIESPAMGALLRVGDLSVADFSKPKQTKTTRRWKVSPRTGPSALCNKRSKEITLSSVAFVLPAS